MSTKRPRAPYNRRHMTPEFIAERARKSREALAARGKQRGPGSYQCVYCKRGYVYISQLIDHEKTCPSRKSVEHRWRKEVTKARNKEVKRGDKEER